MTTKRTAGLLPVILAVAAGVLLFGSAPAFAQADNPCLACHDAAAGMVDAKFQVKPDAWSASAHGAAGFGCDTCHAGSTDDVPHKLGDPWKKCVECHEDAVKAFAGSIHAKAKMVKGAPPINCSSCHGNLHETRVVTDPQSTLFPTKIARTCGKCHGNPDLVKGSGFTLVQPLAAYEASVHGRAVQRGEHAATCSACHGSHGILPAANPKSQVNRLNVPKTCGTCHKEIAAQYVNSIHGKAAAEGVKDAPVCTDCHGEHRIIEPARPDSPVFATNVPKMTCGRCHGDIRLSEKFGLEGGKVASYEDSFHGLASRSGAATVANCSSCHGVHDILPSSDPRSHVNKANIAKTCGACHPGAGERFTIGPVHVLPSQKNQVHPAVYWARVGYLWIIWLTIGGMLLHNFLDFRRKLLSPVIRPILAVAERRERLLLGFRIAHATLAVSFITLAITGFALKYPEAGWAQPLLQWEEKFGLRGWLHRFAAVAMLLAFAYHAVHLIMDRRARRCIAAMRPSIHDIHELKDKFLWYIGKRPVMPLSPPVGYPEKMEYLALVWGTIVMAVTGFLLWFENFTLQYLPKWAVDLSTVVHFYEAILATLAILVWHFYFVIFDPLIYPMDTAWFTGREAPGRSLERHASIEYGEERPGGHGGHGEESAAKPPSSDEK